MRRMIVRWLVVMAVIPVGLAAQDGKQEALQRIQALMDAAEDADIPLSLLQSKIDEGRAKGVDEGRIATALEARLNGLMRAQAVLSDGDVSDASEGDLAVAADALEAGVSEVVLLQIQTTEPGERRTVATAVLTSLVLLGEHQTDALTRVETALSGGPEALASLRSETARQMRARGIGSPGPVGG